MNDNRERRTVPVELEIREDEDAVGTLTGLGIPFNSKADIGPFTETIAPSAAKNIEANDVRALLNHNPDKILGRVPKTLRLIVGKQGVRYEVALPDTTVGRDVRESVRRGDISGSSFAFTVAKDEWDRSEELEKPHRTITEFAEVFDVSPVVYPAYGSTTVSARALELAALESPGGGDDDDEPPSDPNALRRRQLQLVEAELGARDDTGP